MNTQCRKVALVATVLQFARSVDGMARRTTYYEDSACGVEVLREYVYGATAINPDGTTSAGKQSPLLVT